jgi:prevent-host-death family protein
MKFIALRELKIHPSKVLDRLRTDDLVVTRNGKPAAALVALDEDTLDEFVIAHHPRLLKEVDDALEEFDRRGGASHDEMKKLVEKKGHSTRRRSRKRG